MTTELTINLPDSLLKEARKVAEITKTTLEEFISRAVSTQVHQQRDTLNVILAEWPKERMIKDQVWIEEHYQQLMENYPNQWIFVHGQKVCGSHQDMAIAEKQAEQILGNIQQAYPLALFVETSRYVF